jgi:hypothetical protein
VANGSGAEAHGAALLERAHQGIITDRLKFTIDRLPPRQPIRMTLISRSNTKRAKVISLFDHPLRRIQERAPAVYDATMPNTELEDLAGAAQLFRKIDLCGLVYGLPVPTEKARVQIAIELEEPLSGQQRIELRNVGVLLGREKFGMIQGETTGSVLPELALLEWTGPIQVKRVSL